MEDTKYIEINNELMPISLPNAVDLMFIKLLEKEKEKEKEKRKK
tara:strand:+ start:29 stop:160 length:132 start_codon:yes stop_codon:yes gene_type:complete